LGAADVWLEVDERHRHHRVDAVLHFDNEFPLGRVEGEFMHPLAIVRELPGRHSRFWLSALVAFGTQDLINPIEVFRLHDKIDIPAVPAERIAESDRRECSPFEDERADARAREYADQAGGLGNLAHGEARLGMSRAGQPPHDRWRNAILSYMEGMENERRDAMAGDRDEKPLPVDRSVGAAADFARRVLLR